MAKSEKQENEKKEARFPKEALLQSRRYADQRDLLSALLEDGRMYSFGEVDALIERFQKGKVR
ncbi:MAG: hypothetical protein GX299_07005 [Epulopiscium sp.]|jgi:hypothetical protein|nr:hypothetical protein [Candidatus Epulonipiscium sp.]